MFRQPTVLNDKRFRVISVSIGLSSDTRFYCQRCKTSYKTSRDFNYHLKSDHKSDLSQNEIDQAMQSVRDIAKFLQEDQA